MTDDEIKTTFRELTRLINDLTERVERLESYHIPIDRTSPLLSDKKDG